MEHAGAVAAVAMHGKEALEILNKILRLCAHGHSNTYYPKNLS